MRAAIYVPRRPGENPSARRRAARREITQRGWSHQGRTDFYEDAFPAGEALSALLERAERFDAVVVKSLTDLGRSLPTALENAEELIEKGLRVVAIDEGVDSGTRAGRSALDLMIESAGARKRAIGAGLRKTKAEIATEGGWRGGAAPFGWTRGNSNGYVLDLDPDEAKLLREATDRILAGESAREVTHSWNARGVKTARGSAWRDAALRRALRRPYLIGHLPQGNTVVKEPGTKKPLVAAEPLLDEATHRALLKRLGKSKKPVLRNVDSPPTLLGGLAVCAICGSKLTGRHAPDNPSASYYCSLRASKGPQACPGVAVAMHHLEAYVEEWTHAYLAAPGTVEELRKAHADAIALARAHVDFLREQLDALDGVSDSQHYAQLTSQLNDALGTMYELERGGLPEALKRPDLVDAWPTLPEEEKREVIHAVIERIEVAKGQRGRPFSPERVTVHPVVG